MLWIHIHLFILPLWFVVKSEIRRTWLKRKNSQEVFLFSNPAANATKSDTLKSIISNLYRQYGLSETVTFMTYFSNASFLRQKLVKLVNLGKLDFMMIEYCQDYCNCQFSHGYHLRNRYMSSSIPVLKLFRHSNLVVFLTTTESSLTFMQ